MNPEEKEDEGTGISEDEALAESLKIAEQVHLREMQEFNKLPEDGFNARYFGFV